jgi:hypothetical protein
MKKFFDRLSGSTVDSDSSQGQSCDPNETDAQAADNDDFKASLPTMTKRFAVK